MANADKILCPGCGAEMELAPLADFGLLYGFQYHCPRCGWDSPLMQTEREARDMAKKRTIETVVRCRDCMHRQNPQECYMCFTEVEDINGGRMYKFTDLTRPDGFCHKGAKIRGGATDA